jgi:hypothetical protein
MRQHVGRERVDPAPHLCLEGRVARWSDAGPQCGVRVVVRCVPRRRGTRVVIAYVHLFASCLEAEKSEQRAIDDPQRWRVAPRRQGTRPADRGGAGRTRGVSDREGGKSVNKVTIRRSIGARPQRRGAMAPSARRPVSRRAGRAHPALRTGNPSALASRGLACNGADCTPVVDIAFRVRCRARRAACRRSERLARDSHAVPPASERRPDRRAAPRCGCAAWLDCLNRRT